MMGRHIRRRRMPVRQRRRLVAVVRHRRQRFPARPVAVNPKMRALRHQRHPVILNHRHLRPVHLPQNVRRNHPVRRPVGHNAAVQTHNTRQMRRHRVDFVSRQDNRHPGVIQVMQQMHHIVPRLDIHPRSRLVQQQQLRVAHQRPRQKNPLLLPSRQLPDMPPGQPVDAQPQHHLLRQLPFLPPEPRKQRVGHRAPHHHRFLNRHRKVPVNRLQLRHIPGPRPSPRPEPPSPQGPVVKPRFPGLHLRRAQNRAQQRRFPRTAGPQQPHKIPGHHAQVNIP